MYKILAQLLTDTARIREESFVRDMTPEDLSTPGSYYALDVYEAAEMACGEEHKPLVPVVYLLLETSWNDALDWAGDALTYPWCVYLDKGDGCMVSVARPIYTLEEAAKALASFDKLEEWLSAGATMRVADREGNRIFTGFRMSRKDATEQVISRVEARIEDWMLLEWNRVETTDVNARVVTGSVPRSSFIDARGPNADAPV